MSETPPSNDRQPRPVDGLDGEIARQGASEDAGDVTRWAAPRRQAYGVCRLDNQRHVHDGQEVGGEKISLCLGGMKPR
jgi:hypothetical protein